jgi:DNA-binding transcriptional regulator LsrR (DeoR family)
MRHLRRTRAQALRPVLTNPNLKVLSTLVMDAATAKELLEQESPKS